MTTAAASASGRHVRSGSKVTAPASTSTDAIKAGRHVERLHANGAFGGVQRRQHQHRDLERGPFGVAAVTASAPPKQDRRDANGEHHERQPHGDGGQEPGCRAGPVERRKRQRPLQAVDTEGHLEEGVGKLRGGHVPHVPGEDRPDDQPQGGGGRAGGSARGRSPGGRREERGTGDRGVNAEVVPEERRDCQGDPGRCCQAV
jgi:hypothetical protein